MVVILLAEQRLEDTAGDFVLPDRVDEALLRQRPLVFEVDEAVVERMGIVGPDRDAVYLQIGMEFAEGFATGRCDD